MLVLFLILLFASIMYLTLAERERGPLWPWSHRMYEEHPALWFLITVTAVAITATSVLVALVILLTVGA